MWGLLRVLWFLSFSCASLPPRKDATSTVTLHWNKASKRNLIYLSFSMWSRAGEGRFANRTPKARGMRQTTYIFFKYLGKGKSTAVCGFLKDSIQVNLRRLRRYSKSVCQFDLQYFNDYVNPRSKWKYKTLYIQRYLAIKIIKKKHR